MATNFGTKVAINAQKCISTRDSENVITCNGVFAVYKSKEGISDFKGLWTLPWQPNFDQNRQKSHKMAITHAFLREITRMRLLITGVFVVGQSKEDISDCMGLRDVAMATNLWPT